jgi:phage shock protein E
MTRSHGFVSAAGILMIAALAVVMLVSGCRTGEKTSQFDITYEELDELIRTGDGTLRLIDVRTVDEYLDEHIPTAVNIPVATVAEWTKEQAEAELGAVDSDITIVVYCAAGGRASNAKTKLLLLGYDDVRSFGKLSLWEGGTVIGPDPGTVGDL